MFYSLVIPTYDRPSEVTNFLESLTTQTLKNFEIIVVDGSPDDVLHPVIETYKSRLNLQYFHERGLGTSEARNLGCEKSTGDILVFIDSDCIVPASYMQTVDAFLTAHPEIDAFGGPDAADKSFSPFQKAVNYAMTSMLTSGGIRGKKKHVGKFQMRGFNMGMKREAFFKVGGYNTMQVAEDIDLSMRVIKAGYISELIPEAFVYHRRRANIKIFWKQLHFHGKGRIDLHLKHGDALKLVHMLPSFFILGLLVAIIAGLFYTPLLLLTAAGLSLYMLAIFIDSTIQNRSIGIGLLSIVTSFELLFAYGLGIWRNIIVRMLLKKGADSKKSVILKK